MTRILFFTFELYSATDFSTDASVEEDAITSPGSATSIIAAQMSGSARGGIVTTTTDILHKVRTDRRKSELLGVTIITLKGFEDEGVDADKTGASSISRRGISPAVSMFNS